MVLCGCSDDEEPATDLSVDVAVDKDVPQPDTAADTKVSTDGEADMALGDSSLDDQIVDLPISDLPVSDQSVPDAGGDLGPGCGTVTALGCCDGETLKICVSNKLVTTDCAAAGKPKCGWDLKWGWYVCGTKQGLADPSGKAPKSCTATAPDASMGCGKVTTYGCCQGQTLKYCDNGKLKISDCTSSPKCGWDAASKFYDCGTTGAADPSGKHPLSCSGKPVDAGPLPDTSPTPDAGNNCKGITQNGCCAGEVLKFCDSGGKVVSTDCVATKNPKCGWDATYGWYNCGTKGAGDPSGKLPKACPGTAADAGPDKALPDKALPDKALPDKAVPDAAQPDKAVPDKAVPDWAVPDKPIPTARVIISELLIDPKTAADPKGEWIELYNAGTATADIHGWTISDKAGKGQEKYTIIKKAGTVLLKPGAYVLLGVEQVKKNNGYAPVALRITTKWNLDNNKDEVYLHDANKKLVDKVEYDNKKGWAITAGVALSLKHHKMDNNNPKSWCAEKKAWCTTCDKGTPLKKAGCP